MLLIWNKIKHVKTTFLTLAELSENWWWNRPEIKQHGVKGTDWAMAKEPARNYELMRRSPKGRKFKQNYLELDTNIKMTGRLWANWNKAPYRFVDDSTKYNEVGWSPYNELQRIQWNLRLPDSLLVKQFISEIRTFRKIQNIPKPPHANKGKKHRGASWKLIEVLDRKQNDIGQLNASERHKATEAKRLAAKLFVEYEVALAKWRADESLDQAPTHESYL
jgi:hypothetical protein